MTKLEQQLVENLEIRLAFHFTEPVEPDLLPPKDFGKIIKGYSFGRYDGNFEIKKSCSSNISHSMWNPDKPNSQKPISQYSSKILALKGLRYNLEMDYAKKLRDIDILIESEIKAPTE
jgi:hypothetical protein